MLPGQLWGPACTGWVCGVLAGPPANPLSQGLWESHGDPRVTESQASLWCCDCHGCASVCSCWRAHVSCRGLWPSKGVQKVLGIAVLSLGGRGEASPSKGLLPADPRELREPWGSTPEPLSLWREVCKALQGKLVHHNLNIAGNNPREIWNQPESPY